MIVIILTDDEAKEVLAKLANQIMSYGDQASENLTISFLKVYRSIIMIDPTYQPHTTLIKIAVNILFEDVEGVTYDL